PGSYLDHDRDQPRPARARPPGAERAPVSRRLRAVPRHALRPGAGPRRARSRFHSQGRRPRRHRQPQARTAGQPRGHVEGRPALDRGDRRADGQSRSPPPAPSRRVTGARYPSHAGKRVIVTGGATGIGAALVEGFAGQGAEVAFLDIDEPSGEALAARLKGTRFIACDLRDLAALEGAAKAAIDALGGVDVLVNNAANDDRHTIEDVTPEYWDERIATNLRHLFFMSQAVVPAMRAAGGGVILNFGSISWHLGLRDLVTYQTAKA